MKPIIGISSALYRNEGSNYSRLSQSYTRSVLAAGGLPLILPYDAAPEDAARCLTALDGLLLSGGGDLDPRHYGEDPLPGLRRISAAYDSADLGLFREAARIRLPVLGICRGCQVINVALGGSLFQDIPSQLPQALEHNPAGTAMSESCHQLEITERDSIMARCFGTDTIFTNSFHHQGVKQLAPGLTLSARTRDGIVEAFEGTDPGWFLHGVQFHPEAMSAAELPASQGFLRLFGSFVEAAAAWRTGYR